MLSSGLLYGYATPGFVRSHLVETASLAFFDNSTPATTSESSEARRQDANVTAQAIGRAMLKEVYRRLEDDVEHYEERVAERERNGYPGTARAFRRLFNGCGSTDPGLGTLQNRMVRSIRRRLNASFGSMAPSIRCRLSIP